MIDGQISLDSFLLESNNSNNFLNSSKKSQVESMERQIESLMNGHMSYKDACKKVGYQPEEDVIPMFEASPEIVGINIKLDDRAMYLKSALGHLATVSRLDGFKKQCDSNYNRVRSKHSESYISEKLNRRIIGLNMAKTAFSNAFGCNLMTDNEMSAVNFDYEFREFRNEFTGTNGAKKRSNLNNKLDLQKKDILVKKAR